MKNTFVPDSLINLVKKAERSMKELTAKSLEKTKSVMKAGKEVGSEITKVVSGPYQSTKAALNKAEHAASKFKDKLSKLGKEMKKVAAKAAYETYKGTMVALKFLQSHILLPFCEKSIGLGSCEVRVQLRRKHDFQ